MKKRIALISSVLVIVLACAVLFAACAPASDPQKARDNLEDKGYSVILDSSIQPAALTLIGVKGVDTVLEASYSKDDQSEYLCVLYFDSSKKMKEAWEKAKEYAEDEGKDNKEKDDDSDWVVGKSGKMIWYGTKNAVKASR